MSVLQNFRLSVTSIFQFMLGVCLFLLSVIGFVASILGTLMWLSSVFADDRNWEGILFGALIPIAACLCVRNIAVLISSWVEMEWRPLIEVSLISVASIVIMLAVFEWTGSIA